MKIILRFAAVLLALTTVFSLTYVSTASAQSVDETQATITRLENQVDRLETQAADQQARADVLEARADATNNQRRADRLERRAAQLDASAEAKLARVVRIQARIAQLQATLDNAPAPAPAPGDILRVQDLNLSAAAQDALTTSVRPFGDPTTSINRLVASVSTNSRGLFSLADDGRIINQNGRLVTEAQLADSLVVSFSERLSFPGDNIENEFRPLAVNAAANLVTTLNG